MIARVPFVMLEKPDDGAPVEIDGGARPAPIPIPDPYPAPVRPQLPSPPNSGIPFFPKSPMADPVPTNPGVTGSGPVLVEQSLRAAESPRASSSDGTPHELQPVTVEGTASGSGGIPWRALLAIAAVTVAVIVAVLIFRKRGKAL